MPGMNGFEATARLRDLPLTRQPFVIAITANALAGDRERCLSAGMNDYLPKPVKLTDLSVSLARAAHAVEGRANAPGASLRPVQAASLSAVIDPEFVASMKQLGVGLFERAIASFTDDVPRRLATLTAALKARDAQAAESTLHALKGASAMLGGTQAAELCAELSERVARAEFQAAEADVPVLEARVAELARTLSALCAGKPLPARGAP
jgi:CheY-like chemotaxis protein